MPVMPLNFAFKKIGNISGIFIIYKILPVVPQVIMMAVVWQLQWHPYIAYLLCGLFLIVLLHTYRYIFICDDIFVDQYI